MSSGGSQTYYELLQLDPTCTQQDIKQKYRNLALQWHPDRNLNNKQLAHKKFQQISQAFEVLKNPLTRTQYDAKLGIQQRSGNHQTRSWPPNASPGFEQSLSREEREILRQYARQKYREGTIKNDKGVGSDRQWSGKTSYDDEHVGAFYFTADMEAKNYQSWFEEKQEAKFNQDRYFRSSYKYDINRNARIAEQLRSFWFSQTRVLPLDIAAFVVIGASAALGYVMVEKFYGGQRKTKA